MLSKEPETKRFFLELAYNGKPYHGWQIQPNAITVQEKLNSALATLLGKTVNLVGAGRTDTGVHASHFVAHFDWLGQSFNETDLAYKLNRFLPESISVERLVEVDSNTHSRFSAIKRTYHYLICREKNPFQFEQSWFLPKYLNLDLMNQAANLLMDVNDFTSFAKLHTESKTNNCNVTEAQWTQKGNITVFTISADRFLRNMVRAIVGSLVDIGCEKISVDGFKEIIAMKDRASAGQSAPAHGLYLTRIEYPDDLFKVKPKLTFPELF